MKMNARIKKNLANQPAEQLLPETINYIHAKMLNRVPTAGDIKNVKELWNQRWSLAAIGSGLELSPRRVAEALNA